MLTLRQFCASLCCLGGSHAKENHASIFIAIGGDVCSFLARLVWVLPITARVSLIACFEPGHRFGWRHDWLISVGRIGAVGNLAAAEYTCRENEECNVCLCHKCFFFQVSLERLESGLMKDWRSSAEKAIMERGDPHSLSRLKRCKMR